MYREVRKARKIAESAVDALGEALTGVYLYGSSARDEYVSGRSDINLLLVFTTLNREDLKKTAALLRKFGRGFSFLCLTENYISTSLDTFPLEFLDMKLHHQTLHGSDLLSRLEIGRGHLRLQIERELKAKLTLLRQSAIVSGCSERTMSENLSGHLPAMAAVFQGIFYLRHGEAPSRREELFARVSEDSLAPKDLIESLAYIQKKGRMPAGRQVEDVYFTLVETMERLSEEIDEWAPESADRG